jgi:hypothetical protein
VLHFVPLEVRKRTLGAFVVLFGRAPALALVTAVPLAASVIKITAPAPIPFPRPS